ncbi:EpsG family protein [uncultured Chryseobacterium sp.]|uniref:EpsG family protein n=1 Tax=uncultured Chryseobacterium sp. TaxID=259322 RepID=UPI0025D5136D|nr:EpsG family protein [uncultured Chryseobacterium sp.]
MSYYYSPIDLLPYIFIVILLLVMLTTCTITEKKKSLIIFSAFFLFTSLRYGVGWDYFEYKDFITSGETEKFEFLSRLVLDIGYYADFYPLPFAIFSFLILIYTKIVIDRYSENITISWIAFFSIPFLFSASLSTIRQALASSLLLYSFTFAYTKKYLKFLLVILTAYFFHSSGIFGLLIYPIVRWKATRNFLLLLFISSFMMSSILQYVIFSFSFYNNFDTRILIYLRNSDNAKQGIYMPFLFYFLTLFNIYFYKDLVRFKPINSIFISLSTFGVFLYNILEFEPHSAFRIGGMFMSFWILIFPSYPKISKLLVFHKYMVSSALLLIFAFLIDSHIKAYLSGTLEKISFIPYDFWLLHLND